MLNQTVLVGRIVRDPEVKELDTGKKVSNITLAVKDTFKNADGEYNTQFIDVELWGGSAENTAEYCKQGDIVGIKGRIKTDTYEKDGQTHKKTSIVAETVTFLSNSKAKDADKTDEKKDDGMEM